MQKWLDKMFKRAGNRFEEENDICEYLLHGSPQLLENFRVITCFSNLITVKLLAMMLFWFMSYGGVVIGVDSWVGKQGTSTITFEWLVIITWKFQGN